MVLFVSGRGWVEREIPFVGLLIVVLEDHLDFIRLPNVEVFAVRVKVLILNIELQGKLVPQHHLLDFAEHVHQPVIVAEVFTELAHVLLSRELMIKSKFDTFNDLLTIEEQDGLTLFKDVSQAVLVDSINHGLVDRHLLDI